MTGPEEDDDFDPNWEPECPDPDDDFDDEGFREWLEEDYEDEEGWDPVFGTAVYGPGQW